MFETKLFGTVKYKRGAMKVVITGITGFHNRGVEALVRTKIEQMSIRNPHWEFTVLTSTPDYDSQRLQSPNVRFVIDSFRTMQGRVIQRLAPIKFLMKKTGGSISSAIEKYDSTLRTLKEASLVVALAMSQGISQFAGLMSRKHFEAWCFAVQTLLENTDAQILLIPHVQDLTGNNDRIIATNLVRHFNYNPRIKLAAGDHTASEYKGLIGACDFVMAERMHAAIAGLSSGVCTIPVVYSVKGHGIMQDLYDADLAKEFDLPIESFLDKSFTKKVIIKGWKRRDEASDRLSKILPQVRELAMSNFDLLDSLLGR